VVNSSIITHSPYSKHASGSDLCEGLNYMTCPFIFQPGVIHFTL